MCNIDITVVVQHNISVIYSLNVYWSAENGDDTHRLQHIRSETIFPVTCYQNAQCD